MGVGHSDLRRRPLSLSLAQLAAETVVCCEFEPLTIQSTDFETKTQGHMMV